MTEIVGPINVFTAFIDIAEDEQITELEQYLNEKEFPVPIDEDEELLDRIVRIVDTCKGLFEKQDLSPQELENVMFSIVSLFHIVPKEQTAKLLQSLCTTVLAGTTLDNARHRLRLLDLLFCHFDTKSLMASIVFWNKLEMAVQYQLGSHIDIDMEKLKRWMGNWKFTLPEQRKVLRLVWELYKSTDKKQSLSCQVLTELVSTFTSADDKEEVAALVKELVAMAISDPNRYIFNELLEIEAVKSQQSEKIYQLLELFATGRYASFLKFNQLNPGYIDSLGLQYKACEHKIKVLTLLSLAEESTEIPFSLGLSELQIDMTAFEQLLIDAIRYQLINARIDHVNQKVIVTNCVRRTFGLNEWTLIHDCLTSWKQNISNFRSNLKSLQFSQHSGTQ